MLTIRFILSTGLVLLIITCLIMVFAGPLTVYQYWFTAVTLITASVLFLLINKTTV